MPTRRVLTVIIHSSVQGILDGIPFSSLLRFDIELLSWVRGTVDYATTVYWYGDMGAKSC